jgi:hypothetical protein
MNLSRLVLQTLSVIEIDLHPALDAEMIDYYMIAPPEH